MSFVGSCCPSAPHFWVPRMSRAFYSDSRINYVTELNEAIAYTILQILSMIQHAGVR